MFREILLTVVCLLILFFAVPGKPQSVEVTYGEAIILDVSGPIGPATRDFIKRSIEDAEKLMASIIIIRMDTPGGLDSAMRGIIKDIIGSSVPVATYVSPSGSRAASAGTYILYASHVAAMAPATNLGAATPVNIAFTPNQKKEKNKQDILDTMSKKMRNDAAAYIKSLAKMRGRNEAWAERAVLDGVSLSADEALKKGVIDIIANDIDELLEEIHGVSVVVQGKHKIMRTERLKRVYTEPDWRNRFLSVITNPNIAYILMMVGIYGLFLEFYSPGSIVPGVAGAICLFLALYAFQLLPVNYAGIILILLGVILMVCEAFVPGIGALGIGGVISTVIGSIILMDAEVPGFQISLPLIGMFAFFSSSIFFLLIILSVQAHKKPVRSGKEGMVGEYAKVVNNFEHEGTVICHSETWQARSEQALIEGQEVRVTRVSGLVLEVEPLHNPKTEES